MMAYAGTTQGFTPSQFGITTPGGNQFPEIKIASVEASRAAAATFTFGANPSFGNAGLYQNQFEGGDHAAMGEGTPFAQLRRELGQYSTQYHQQQYQQRHYRFQDFSRPSWRATVRTGANYSTAFVGSADRYYRSNTAGVFVNDNIKVKSNLTVNLGLRWDLDGPLSEKYGRLTGVQREPITLTTRPRTPSPAPGWRSPGTMPTMGTAGASNSLMTQHQWGFAPRIGIAWKPVPKLTVRAGAGIYYDRGELFTLFERRRGRRIQRSVRRDPVASVRRRGHGAAPASTFANPFPGAGAVIPGSPAAFLAQLPNLADTTKRSEPAGKPLRAVHFQRLRHQQQAAVHRPTGRSICSTN